MWIPIFSLASLVRLSAYRTTSARPQCHLFGATLALCRGNQTHADDIAKSVTRSVGSGGEEALARARPVVALLATDRSQTAAVRRAVDAIVSNKSERALVLSVLALFK